MNTEVMNRTKEGNEFKEFTSYFLKYLNGSVSFEEAFVRATNAYKKLFKRAPYQNCQSFLSDFYKTQYES
ncbi:MAG: hypothetical protein MI975_04480 [Cytophagales bacterium]|nr:hypothetical protein [Cytophagales bacterium]